MIANFFRLIIFAGGIWAAVVVALSIFGDPFLFLPLGDGTDLFPPAHRYETFRLTFFYAPGNRFVLPLICPGKKVLSSSSDGDCDDRVSSYRSYHDIQGGGTRNRAYFNRNHVPVCGRIFVQCSRKNQKNLAALTRQVLIRRRPKFSPPNNPA